LNTLTATLTAAAAVIWISQRGGAQPPPNKNLFVRGFVEASVSARVEKLKLIALPHASVFLVRAGQLNTPVASALSDLSGRFSIRTSETGTFQLCVEADGFPRFCPSKEFRLFSLPVRYGHLVLPVSHSQDTANAYGQVTLLDGSLARGFEPFMTVNSYPVVEFGAPRAKPVRRAYVNNFGEYILPGIPIRRNFVFRAIADKEVLERPIDQRTGIAPGRDYPFDFQFNNTPPRLRLLTPTVAGKPVQIVAPGATVVIKAVTEDREKDSLEYRWLLPDGTMAGPNPTPELSFTAPGRIGRFGVDVLVSDNRGGYLRSSYALVVSNGDVPFSGLVVDTGGAPIGGAQIDVNGRLTNANARGVFGFRVPVAGTYVLTIRSLPSFGTASYVYNGSVAGGKWVLRRATVSSFDPTKPISLQHKREKGCDGSVSGKMNWQSYLKPGLFEWQDGRGNARVLAEVGKAEPQAIQGVLRLLFRMNPSLVSPFAAASRVRYSVDLPRLPCGPGIQVDIPPGSLEDPTTHLAPSGNVQVSVSTVSLTAGDQMPGDYSAVSGTKSFSMESYGAGSVEVSSGGSHFNLKSGKTATVTIPVDPTQIAGNATPPQTIPFLHYDERSGVWKREGSARLKGSGANAVYVAKVKHFSTMNADILKSGQSCVAVEVDPQANFVLPFNVEVTLPPSKPNPTVIQVRTLNVNSSKSNVIYNLPNDTNIVLTPIIQGVRPDGSTGDVPAGIFVVNTGGAQIPGTNPPQQNPDGTYYAESNGQPTGPCGSRVTLKQLNGPTLANGFEFLQGFYFESSNITEFAQTSQAIADNIVQGATDYYAQADPRSLRNSFNLFKQKNRFGQALNANEVEFDAQYANSGDLGFGRDMHCRRNVGTDNAFDLACYVTNYGQPPVFDPDQTDADNALAGQNPDATVAMEFSRVENAPNVNPEFPDNVRATKFFVYNTAAPDSAPIKQADLDGFGARPVPQLCVICHGGQVSSIAADPNNPSGPKQGAFANRNDILSMTSNFLPFDLHLYNFPANKNKAGQQAAFKNLNVEIVHQVATANGAPGAAIAELIDAFYANNSASQLEDAVITNWDAADPNSDSHRFYRDVFGRACRTCHIAQPFTGPAFTNKADFQNDIVSVQNRVCDQKVMPHAKRTNDVFWTSLNPNMPGFLQLYGQTLPNWSSADASQCGLFVQPGNNVQSYFSTHIYPVLSGQCAGCHGTVGNANWSVGNLTNTYNSLLNALAKDGVSHYIVPNNLASSLLYQRITTSNIGSGRMPLGGPDLTVSDTNNDGQIDSTEFQTWINSGAVGP
jgi:cytochrome c5